MPLRNDIQRNLTFGRWYDDLVDKGLVQTGNVWRPNNIKHCLVTKHFTVWLPCLMLFDRVWSCLIKCEVHQSFDQLLFVWPAVSNMFGALAQVVSTYL